MRVELSHRRNRKSDRLVVAHQFLQCQRPLVL